MIWQIEVRSATGVSPITYTFDHPIANIVYELSGYNDSLDASIEGLMADVLIPPRAIVSILTDQSGSMLPRYVGYVVDSPETDSLEIMSVVLRGLKSRFYEIDAVGVYTGSPATVIAAIYGALVSSGRITASMIVGVSVATSAVVLDTSTDDSIFVGEVFDRIAALCGMVWGVWPDRTIFFTAATSSSSLHETDGAKVTFGSIAVENLVTAVVWDIGRKGTASALTNTSNNQSLTHRSISSEVSTYGYSARVAQIDPIEAMLPINTGAPTLTSGTLTTGTLANIVDTLDTTGAVFTPAAATLPDLPFVLLRLTIPNGSVLRGMFTHFGAFTNGEIVIRNEPSPGFVVQTVETLRNGWFFPELDYPTMTNGWVDVYIYPTGGGRVDVRTITLWSLDTSTLDFVATSAYVWPPSPVASVYVPDLVPPTTLLTFNRYDEDGVFTTALVDLVAVKFSYTISNDEFGVTRISTGQPYSANDLNRAALLKSLSRTSLVEAIRKSR